MKFIVRDQFAVKIGKDVFEGGEIVDLDDEQAEAYANAIEPAEKPKAAAKAAKAEAAAE